MKKIIVFSVFLFCGLFTIKANSQSSKKKKSKIISDKIIYDFDTKLYKQKLIYPKIDHPVVFIIENINRLAYNVKIESKDSSLAQANASDFIQKFLLFDTTKKAKDPSEEKEGKLEEDKETTPAPSKVPTLTKTQREADSINKISKKITLRKAINRSSDIANKENELEKKETELISIRNNIKYAIYLSNNIDTIIKYDTTEITNRQKRADSLNKEKDNILKSLIKLNSQETVLTNKIQSIKSEITELKKDLDIKTQEAFELRSKLIVQKNKVVVLYDSLDIIKLQYNNILLIAKNPHLKQNEVEKELKKVIIDSQLYNLKYLYSMVSNLKNNIVDFKATHHNFITSSVVAKAYNEFSPKTEVQPFFDVVAEIDSVVKKANHHQIIQDLYLMINSLRDPQNFTIVSAPIQPKEDLVIFNIDIKHKDTSGRFLTDDRSFKYRDYVKGGIRYDFSTGIALNFGLNDRSYRLDDIVGTDSVKIMTNKERSGPSPQIAAMFHTSIRATTLCRTGFTIGSTLNTADFNISSLFFGLSAMFGRSEKFICTMGMALKNIKILDGRYENEQKFKKGNISETVLSEKKIMPGFFISFSYSLTQKQKQ